MLRVVPAFAHMRVAFLQHRRATHGYFTPFMPNNNVREEEDVRVCASLCASVCMCLCVCLWVLTVKIKLSGNCKYEFDLVLLLK